MNISSMVGIVRRPCSILAIGMIAAGLGIAGSASAVQIVAWNSANGQGYEVIFDDDGVPVNTIALINADQNLRTTVESLVIRPDLDGQNIFVADSTNGGEIALYEGEPPTTNDAPVVFSAYGTTVYSVDEGVGPANVNGLSLDSDGNLFVVSATNGSSPTKVWYFPRNTNCAPAGCRPGGYGEPQLVVDDAALRDVVGTSPILEESIVDGDGDLLVVSSNPAVVLKITDPTGSPTVAPFITDFPSGSEPVGIAFSPLDTAIFISDNGGLIRKYTAQGQEDGLLAQGLGQGKNKIRTAIEGGIPRAYVTNNNGGEILRFDIPASGPIDPATTRVVTSGVQSPVGIDVTTANAVYTAAGNGVAIAPTEIFLHNIETVCEGGITGEEILVYLDPREDETEPCGVSRLADGYCPRDLLLSELDAGLPDTRLGPQYRGFPRNGNPDDVVLIIADAATTACVTGFVGHEAFEEEVIDGSDCFADNASFRPLVMWAPNPLRLEDPTHECVPGGTDGTGLTCALIDITTDCNSGKGGTREWSTFAIGVRRDIDIQPEEAAVIEKYLATGQTIEDATCVDNRVLKKMARQYATAGRHIDRGRWLNGASALEELALIVFDNASAFEGCSINYKGDIQGRACSTAFTIRDYAPALTGDPATERLPIDEGGSPPPLQCQQPSS